jgi:hypothetical protein
VKNAKKNSAAVALARRRMITMTAEERIAVAQQGGLKGGKARAKALTSAQRKEIAKKAADARWAKAKAKPKPKT